MTDRERQTNESANIRYAKAPIREAILRVQFEPMPAAALVFKRIAHALAPQYTVVDEDTAAHSVLAGDTSESDVLYLQSLEERHIVRLRSDSFMFSQLGSYDTWVPFASEARRLWDVFRDNVGPVRSQSYGLRFINQMDVPTDTDIAGYLRTYPQVAPDLPQIVSNFFMRLELPIQETGLLVLQELLSDSRKPGSVSVILDYETTFPAINIGSDEALWRNINDLRTLKNQIFRACVTPQMEDTFK